MATLSERKSDKTPDVSLLRRIRIDTGSSIPLHMQVRQGLMDLIENCFEIGASFFSEKVLIENLSVSQITVNRALQDLQRNGILYRERGRGTTVIRHAIEQNGHVKNSSSGNVSKSLKSIGMLVMAFESDYLSEMTEQLAQASHERHLDFHVYYYRSEEHLPNIMSKMAVDPQEEAIVTLLPAAVTGTMQQALELRGFRNVALDGITSGFAGSSVITDARAAVNIGMSYLVELGHQRIVLLVNEPLNEQSVVEKLDEFHRFSRASERSIIGYPVICDTSMAQNPDQMVFAHMDEVWALKPTAIFTVSDPGAWAVMKWLNERGISIPGEVSILGFEDARSSKYLHPALSSVAHPLAHRARRALEILCDEYDKAPLQERIQPYLVVRESTGPVSF